jgi:hypothetical protein
MVQQMGAILIDDEAIGRVVGRGIAHEIDGDTDRTLRLTKAAKGNVWDDIGHEFFIVLRTFRQVHIDPTGQNRCGYAIGNLLRLCRRICP